MFKRLCSVLLIVSASFLATGSGLAAVLPDPTRPYTQKSNQSVAKTVYTLHSVLVSSGRRVAVINNAVYSEGDKTPIGKLTAIRSDHVVISGKRRHILKLGTESLRD